MIKELQRRFCMKNVFIVGSKGIPANYGGFETFVDELVSRKKDSSIQYHVACLSDHEEEFYYKNTRCFKVKVPQIGPAKAVYYDLMSLHHCVQYIKKHQFDHCIIYVLACRIGPFFHHYVKKLHKLGAKVFVNPDGHEWKRAKWNAMIKKYWKISEKYMVKHADLLVCDSKNIEKYIQEDYQKYQPKTTFIAYGADTTLSTLADDDSTLLDYYKQHDISAHQYYLAVGRFVPENNFEIMLREFMKTKTTKDFVLITNVENNGFYNDLKEKTHFDTDPRIKFVGTLYDSQMLKKVRENAYGYLHGHSVGGTNPSLLEALATTSLNLLYDVGFNREVGEDGAIYFNDEPGNLSSLIDQLDCYSKEAVDVLSKKAKARIQDAYAWDDIVQTYEDLFNGQR